MAVKAWDSSSDKIYYKRKMFVEDSTTWVRKVKFPKKTIPSEQEAFEAYQKIFSIHVDKDTSFVKITIKHKSPQITKKWLDLIIFNINESMRSEDIRVAEASIQFLNDSKELTQIQSVKEVIADLLENEIQTLMLASANKNYIFKVIDSPIIPEKKSGPNRAIICVLITISGLIFSILLVIFNTYRKSQLLLKKQSY